MAVAVYTPRVNNNDDEVRFTRTFIASGAPVRAGDVIAEIETDKATFTVEAEVEGYLLSFVQPTGEMISVGSVLAWIGSAPDEAVPADPSAMPAVAAAGGAMGEPTLKALLLLNRLGLDASAIPASSDRLTAQDVLAYAQRTSRTSAPGAPAAPPPDDMSDVAPGERRPLTVAERGMVRTVSWHARVAVPGYVEIPYDPAAWASYAAEFRSTHQLLMDPLLPLMAYALVRLAKATPKLNATIAGDARHEYLAVNLGFTVQSGDRLTLLTVPNADSMTEKAFTDTLGALMRQSLKGALSVEHTSGATVSFTSMARWQVARHTPILPPHTSLIVAHASGDGAHHVLGATYDHRVLTGGEVAVALRTLSAPDRGAAES